MALSTRYCLELAWRSTWSTMTLRSLVTLVGNRVHAAAVSTNRSAIIDPVQCGLVRFQLIFRIWTWCGNWPLTAFCPPITRDSPSAFTATKPTAKMTRAQKSFGISKAKLNWRKKQLNRCHWINCGSSHTWRMPDKKHEPWTVVQILSFCRLINFWFVKQVRILSHEKQNASLEYSDNRQTIFWLVNIIHHTPRAPYLGKDFSKNVWWQR